MEFKYNDTLLLERMSRKASLKKKLSHKKKPQFGSAD